MAGKSPLTASSGRSGPTTTESRRHRPHRFTHVCRALREAIAAASRGGGLSVTAAACRAAIRDSGRVPEPPPADVTAAAAALAPLAAVDDDDPRC